mgnify:FL=1
MSEYVMHYRAKRQQYCPECDSTDVRVRRWAVTCHDCGHITELP